MLLIRSVIIVGETNVHMTFDSRTKRVTRERAAKSRLLCLVSQIYWIGLANRNSTAASLAEDFDVLLKFEINICSWANDISCTVPGTRFIDGRGVIVINNACVSLEAQGCQCTYIR